MSAKWVQIYDRFLAEDEVWFTKRKEADEFANLLDKRAIPYTCEIDQGTTVILYKVKRGSDELEEEFELPPTKANIIEKYALATGTVVHREPAVVEKDCKDYRGLLKYERTLIEQLKTEAAIMEDLLPDNGDKTLRRVPVILTLADLEEIIAWYQEYEAARE